MILDLLNFMKVFELILIFNNFDNFLDLSIHSFTDLFDVVTKHTWSIYLFLMHSNTDGIIVPFSLYFEPLTYMPPPITNNFINYIILFTYLAIDREDVSPGDSIPKRFIQL